MILLYMKNSDIWFYTSLIILLIIFFYILFECFFCKLEEGMENKDYVIPKKIWTYWDKNELPEFVKNCINTWKKHNPDYKVIVLNNSNLNTYLPELDINNLKHVERPAHFSDVIRVHIIAKYGGIWSDASIVCLQSYDPILERMKKRNFEFFGYHIWGSTNHINGSSDNMKTDFPVIENWFFVAPPNAPIISDWKDKLMECQQYDTKEDYLNEMKKNTNLDKIKDNMKTYLWMHCAMQGILQKNKGKYNIEVRKAEDGPFKYLENNKWDIEKAVDEVIDCNKKNSHCEILKTPFIKFRSVERHVIQNKGCASDFFN